MNFSEYVAILSGNTDLLEKARLDKKVAALESERKSYNRNKSISEVKLNTITEKIKGNNELVARMAADKDAFTGRVQYDSDGNILNPLKLDGVESADVKDLSAKLAHINDHTTTNGEHYRIGELYGFRLLIQTENSQKEGTLFKQNRFFVEGDGNIKYTHNNGHLATDPKLAVHYFLRALEKIPFMIEKYRTDTEKLSIDLPVLQEVVNAPWRKENELKDLKTELAALDRKIHLSLKPIDESEDKQQSETPENQTHKASPKVPIVPFVPTVPDNAANHTETIQALLSGKINPNDIKSTIPSNPIPDRLQQAKEAMGDRLIIASIPKYNFENQSKGIKI
jgi:hypothetical protein